MLSDYKVRWGVDDAVCVVAFIIMISMSLIAYVDVMTFNYEINTGLFCGVACLFPLILKHLHVMTLSVWFNVMIAITIFIHANGVLMMSYDTLVFYDTLTHTAASITVAMCVFYTLMCYHVYTGGKVDFAGRFMPLMITLIMLGFSAYWEVFEFIADMLWNTGMQYSPFDTIRDTICNTFGASLVTMCASRYLKKHSPEEIVASFNLHPRLTKFISDPFSGKDGE